MASIAASPSARRRRSASTAITPVAEAISGLMVASLISGKSTTRAESRTSASDTASTFTASWSRQPCRRREIRVRPISAVARTRFSGGRSTASSACRSAVVPPAPKPIQGPNITSSPRRRRSSAPGCACRSTSRPSMRQSGRSCAARVSMARPAARTLFTSRRPTATPPISVLRGSSALSSLSTTGKPISMAALPASAGLATTRRAMVGTP